MYFHLQDLPSISTWFFIKLSPLHPSCMLIFALQQCSGVSSPSFFLTPTTLPCSQSVILVVPLPRSAGSPVPLASLILFVILSSFSAQPPGCLLTLPFHFHCTKEFLPYLLFPAPDLGPFCCCHFQLSVTRQAYLLSPSEYLARQRRHPLP